MKTSPIETTGLDALKELDQASLSTTRVKSTAAPNFGEFIIYAGMHIF